MEIAEGEVRSCLSALPAVIAEPARELPVSYEDVPPEDEDDADADPDLLGLFIGAALDEDGGDSDVPLPAQVILYLDNIWDYADGREREYRREVRKTYLHELGHFLGLDENDLVRRGMD